MALQINSQQIWMNPLRIVLQCKGQCGCVVYADVKYNNQQLISNMLQISENEVSVHLCTFEAHFQRAKVNLRFPSSFFVEWKAINNKNSVSTVGRKKAINSVIELDQALTFSTEMIYHRIQKHYLKKQSLIHLNLISNSRPDQIKLVGRVIIDMAEVANKNSFADVTTLKLMYCSVDAELTFRIKFVRSVQSNIELNQLDKSAFSDLYSFTSPKIGHKNRLEYRETLSERRSEDERRRLPRGDREDFANSRVARATNPKAQKILIRQPIEQPVEPEIARSLPLSEKKSLKEGNEYRTEQRKPKPVVEIPESGAQQLQTLIMKQRNLLEKELEEHKERIKKLENEIKAALKMFEQTQTMSEMNRSKLIETEQTVYQLIDKEHRMKAEYQKLLAAQKEEHERQISVIKNGYEADIKILQATMEEERTKLVELQKSSKNLMGNYQQAKNKVKEQELLLLEAESSKNQIGGLKIERQQLLLRLSNKQTDKVELQSVGRKNEQQLSKVKSQFQVELSRINTLLKNKQENVLSLQHINSSLLLQLSTLQEQNLQLTNRVEQQKQTYRNVAQSSDRAGALANKIGQLQAMLQSQVAKINAMREHSQQQLLSARSLNDQLRAQNQNLKLIIQKLTEQAIATKKTVQSQRVIPQMALAATPQLKTTPQKRQELQQIKEYTIQINVPADEHDLHLDFDFLTNKNKSPEPSEEDRHRFHFEGHHGPFTQEDINQLAFRTNTDRQMHSLKEQNAKLKEELEHLKQLTASKQGQSVQYLKEKQNLILAHSAIVQQLQHERESLNQQLNSLNEQIQVMNERPIILTSEVETINGQTVQQNHKLQEYQKIITQQNVLSQSLQSKIYELEGLISKNNQKLSHIEKDQRYIQELEEKLTELEEQLKIKDELLGQSERNMEESYAIKYQLSDLKQKFVELKSALNQRDTYINELEEAKDNLARELEKTSSQKNLNFELKLQKVGNQSSQLIHQINNAQVDNSQIIANQLNGEIAYLKGEIEQLNRQLIVYNNESTELKNRIQDYKNEKTQIQSRLQLVRIKVVEYETVMSQLRAQKQKLQVQLNEQRAKEEQNRLRIDEQIGSLTSKLVEMENNLRALPDNEAELNELRHAVQVANNQKNSLSEELLLKIQANKQLSTQIQNLNGSISQLQTFNRDLSANMNKVQDELLTQIDHTQNLQTELQSIKANNAAINKMLEEANQMTNSLKLQLQESNSKAEQLKKQMELIGQQKQKVQPEKVKKNELDIQITLHKVDSAASEVPPIVYEKSVIVADEANLYKKQTNNKEQVVKLSEENQRLKEDNKLLSQDNQKLKGEVSVLSQNMDKNNKQMEKILSELGHENEQKFFYFNELENSKALVQKLQKQIKALKEKNQNMNILPLQSFDTNHLLRLKNRPQVIIQEQKQRQPSIIQQIQVNAQPEIIAQNQEQSPSLQSKKGAEPKTQLQTNMAEQSCVGLMRRDLDLAKQELEKERKEHRQLQETHKVCIQKYEMLVARYHSCLSQLEYFQGEADKAVRLKQKTEEDLYRSQVVIENLNEQAAKTVKENQQLTELLLNAQENKQPVIEINQINQSPKEQEIKVVRIQQQNPIATAPAQNQAAQTERLELLRVEYENKISQLLKSEQQYKNKAALLEQNLQNLQKMLQEQIQINQNHEKPTEKLEDLRSLEAMAEKFKSEITLLKNQNTQLRRMQTHSDIVPHQKGQLTRIIEGYQDRTTSKIALNNQAHLQLIEENIVAPTEVKIQEDIKPQIIEVRVVQAKDPNVQTVTKIEAAPQSEALLVEIEQLRREKLQNLQKLYSLQQKLNGIQIIKTARQLQNEQELNLRLHQIEQLRFAYEQISKEYQEEKTEKQLKKQSMKVQYQQSQNEIKRLNRSIAKHLESNKNYQTEIADLKNNINVMQQEKRNAVDAAQGNDELQKVKTQMQNKVFQVEQLVAQKTEAVQQITLMNEQITSMTSQITEMKSLLQSRKQQKVQKDEQLKSLGLLYAQLTQQKQVIEKQLKQLEQKNKRIEQQLSIVKNRSESKDEKMTTMRNQITQAEKKLSALSAKIKFKEEQGLALAKENLQLKASNTANEQKIKLLDQKEKQLKETVTLLELQSKKIVDSIKQRFVSEANYYKKYVEKEKEYSNLSAAAAQFQQNIANKERELLLERQIASQLKNELDVIKNGAGAPELPQILTIEIQKYNQLKDAHEKLINVNKEYLQNIGKKSTISIENQRLKQELKALTMSFNEMNSLLNQIKDEYQSHKIECSKSLSKLEANLASQSQKSIELNKQLSMLKENKVAVEQKYYDNLIAQKNKEIESLRREVVEAKSKKESEIREESKMTPSQLDILNQQIYSLNNDILDKERQISQLKKELDQFKQMESPAKQKAVEGGSFKRITSQVLAENNIFLVQKQINIVESNINKSAPEPQVINQTINNNQNMNAVGEPLHIICEKIKQLCNNRNSNNKEGLFEAFVKKYDQIEEQFLYIGLQTTQIQQKARYISKELQKLKAYIIKSQNRAFKQKTEILALIKPCEHTANELISLSETLNEGDSNAFL